MCMRIIMHIDVNNAFLSWSAILLLKQGYKYDIRNSYAAIGFEESARHGIVLSTSTPAKKDASVPSGKVLKQLSLFFWLKENVRG